MKNFLTLLAVLVLSIVLFNQDKAFAASTVKDADGNPIPIVKLNGKQSVVLPIEIKLPTYLSSETITSENIYLMDAKGNRITAVASAPLKVLTVIPKTPLKYAKQYSVVINEKVLTINDEPLPAKVYTFTTEAKPKDKRLDVTNKKKVAFTREEFKLFEDVLYSEQNKKVVKWNTSINVALLGKPSASDKKEVNKVLKEISALTGLPAKITSAKNANFKIYFGNVAAGEKHMGVKLSPYIQYGVDWKSTKKAYIYSANAYINTLFTPNLSIRRVISSGLGFPSHYYGGLGTTFRKNPGYKEYTAVDKKIIKALYSPFTPAGTTYDQLYKVYRIWN